MQTVVVYDSKFGNTEKIAQAIGRGAATLGSVRVVATGEAGDALVERPDVLLVGGPTQKRGMSAGLQAFVDTVGARGIAGVATASFDTRYRGPGLIMGSAAGEAAKRLRKAGGQLVSAPESFFIGRSGPMERQVLEPGEIERAEAWGRAVVGAATAPQLA